MGDFSLLLLTIMLTSFSHTAQDLADYYDCHAAAYKKTNSRLLPRTDPSDETAASRPIAHFPPLSKTPKLTRNPKPIANSWVRVTVESFNTCSTTAVSWCHNRVEGAHQTRVSLYLPEDFAAFQALSIISEKNGWFLRIRLRKISQQNVNNLPLPDVHVIQTPDEFVKTPLPVKASTSDKFTKSGAAREAAEDTAIDLEDVEEMVTCSLRTKHLKLTEIC
ncbi:hypothetical protein R3P38DRAFT_2765569 [Favolaschia claudopus]|uniref:Uncharacterized protein n=1 Tax=Favolaschia claudopus TaxID=2862362 RepID=A0AAW0D6P0_9AGAR